MIREKWGASEKTASGAIGGAVGWMGVAGICRRGKRLDGPRGGFVK